MNPSEKTIRFLRNLTSDGLLSGEEIWSLANFLNDNEESQQSWPGNLLFGMLHSAFDDGQLTEEEMELLASTVAQIEQEWLAKNPSQRRAYEQSAVIQLPPLVKPRMPSVDFQVHVPSARNDLTFVVDLARHSCTCDEWPKRKPWPEGHPGRCCKHVAYAFARSGKVVEPWFQAILDDCFERGRGTNPGDDWVMFKPEKRRPVLISGGETSWSWVYSFTEERYERFGFNRADNRWSYGAEPPEAVLVEKAIHEAFGQKAAI